MGLRAVAALRHLLERLEALQVGNARSRGWSWKEIADHLGVSEQAVHKKYAGSHVLGRGAPPARETVAPAGWTRRLVIEASFEVTAAR